MEYVLGIDQGGSKTHAVVADAGGRILGMGKSYGACHSSNGLDYAIEVIREASDMALESCRLTQQDVTTVVGGLTGIDWDDEAPLLEDAIQKLFPRARVKVVNDCIIAMRAATREKRCGILCAGSGLNCAVQNGDECFAYGFYIPDEHQGGCSLGKKAVQAVFDSHMGLLPETLLTERLLAHFHVKTVDELLFLRVTGKITGTDYLRLPIIIAEEACAGDRVAADIWIDYGKLIANYLVVRTEKMGISGEKMDVVLSGSIFKCRFLDFQRTVKEEILRRLPAAHVIEAAYEPVMGAVVMGLQMIHGEVAEEIYGNLEETSKQFPLRRLEGENGGNR